MSVIATAARLACIDIYSPIDHTYIQKIYQYKDTVCGKAEIDGITYLVLQGTETAEGWETDFDIDPMHHPILGDLHGGFYDGAYQILLQVLPELNRNKPVIVCGHSKGAGEGVILSALLKLNGIPNIANILFACPNSGQKKFTEWLSNNIHGISFRNALFDLPWMGDPIPLVPPRPYTPPYPHAIFRNPPPGLINKFILPKWHNATLYYNYGSKL